MMTSSGSGAYRVGGLGSLSSSNLSPLAAPFRVDKPLQKQNSTTYPDVPMYGPYSDPASQLWNHSLSSANGSKFAETESTGIKTTSYSSPTVYHIGSGSGSVAHDPFSYDPFPNPVSTASEEGVKSYYSPYVPPQARKDGYLNTKLDSGHNFGLSDSSTTLTSDRGIWSGVNGEGKWSGYVQEFCPQESNQSDLLSSKSPFLVGGINKSQPSAVVHTRPFVIGSSNNNIPDGGNKSNPRKDVCFDIFDGGYSLGIDQHIRSLLGNSGLPTSVSSSVPNESSHLVDPVVQPLTNFCGSQMANGSSSGAHFGQNDFYVFGCSSSTATPVTNYNSPYRESSSSADVSFSALKTNPKVRIEANESNIFTGNDYSHPIVPQFPLGLKRQSRVVIRRPPSSSVIPPSSSSQTGGSLQSKVSPQKTQAPFSVDKGQVSPQKTHQFSSGGLDLEVDKAQAPFSVDKISGVSDVHNPGEDSPCWRGASLKVDSPFRLSEDMAPNVFAINFEEWRSPNSQVKSSSESRDFLSLKAKEGNVSERPLAPECGLKDNEERVFGKWQPLCVDLNADGLEAPDGSFVSTKECLVQNNSKTDSLPGRTLGGKRVSTEMEIPSPIQMSETVVSEGSGKSPPVMANNSFGVPSGSENNHSSPFSQDMASQNHCQATNKIPDTNIDVNMLLKAMMNLSEIFRTYCFNKQASVPEHHSISIKRVISNLNASLVMLAGESSSTMPSSKVDSLCKDLPDAQMVNDAAFEALAAAVKLGETTDGLFYSGFVKDDPNAIGDVNISEAVKKMLHENFHVEEETDQQKLLYKTLWLDAEASLCAMTAKARFLRVKAEMEKTHDNAKEEDIPSNANTSGDAHEPVDLANHGNTSSVPNVGNDSDNNVVEDSVMARYQILKTRIETSETPIQDNKESSGGPFYPPDFYPFGCNSHFTGTTGDFMGDEVITVLDRIRAMNSQVDNDSLNNECDSLPGEDNYLPNRESASPIYQILDSGENNSDSLYKGEDSINSQLLSNSVGVSEVGEASVMARFRIIQSRVSHSDSDGMDKILIPPLNGPNDETDDPGLFGLQNNVRSAFGPYPEFTEDEDEDINQFTVGAHKEQYSNQYKEFDRMNGQILEGWYGNDCSSSDWEHVSKDDLRRSN